MDSHAPDADARRPEDRAALSVPARLHPDGAAAAAVVVTDLTPHGCRVDAVRPLASGHYVTLVLTGTIIIAGRVAWSAGDAIGIDFCEALNPRALAAVLAAPASA